MTDDRTPDADLEAMRREFYAPQPRRLDPSLPLPRNAARLLQKGIVAGSTLIASFVGETQFDGAHVFADSGRRYDWEFTAGLLVAIVVKPGIDAGHAISSIFRVCNPLANYPQIIDIERRQVAYLVDGAQGLKLWTVKNDSELWKHYFE